MSLWNRIPVRVMERWASISKASLLMEWNVDKHVRVHARLYARASPRMGLLASLLPFLSLFFFLFFTWATWRRVLTPGDSCENSSTVASLIVCDSGIPFGSRGGRGIRNIDVGRRNSYLSRSPRVSDTTRSSSLYPQTFELWPLTYGSSRNTIQPYRLILLIFFPCILSLSRIFFFTTNVN